MTVEKYRNSIIRYRGSFTSLESAEQMCRIQGGLKSGDAVFIYDDQITQDGKLYIWNGENWSEYPQYQKSNIDIEDIVTDIIVCPVVVSYSENISVDDAVEKAILVTKHTIIDMIRSTFDGN